MRVLRIVKKTNDIKYQNFRTPENRFRREHSPCRQPWCELLSDSKLIFVSLLIHTIHTIITHSGVLEIYVHLRHMTPFSRNSKWKNEKLTLKKKREKPKTEADTTTKKISKWLFSRSFDDFKRYLIIHWDERVVLLQMSNDWVKQLPEFRHVVCCRTSSSIVDIPHYSFALSAYLDDARGIIYWNRKTYNARQQIDS